MDGSDLIPDPNVLVDPYLTGKKSWTLDSRGNWDDMTHWLDGAAVVRVKGWLSRSRPRPGDSADEYRGQAGRRATDAEDYPVRLSQGTGPDRNVLNRQRFTPRCSLRIKTKPGDACHRAFRGSG